MAERPWVTPQEVREYSELEAVQNRSDARLEMDISRAEQYIITYTHNKFADYETIPAPVRTAAILLAEAYATYAHYVKKTGGGTLKSETFDDYAYSAGDTSLETLIGALDLAALLDDFIITAPRNGVTLRMRRL